MNDPLSFVLDALAADPNIAPTLARAFEKQQPRRFTGEPPSGYMPLSEPTDDVPDGDDT